MKQLTIRNVGSDLHQAVKNEARRRGLSINRYVLLILRDAVGLGDGQSNQTIEFHDLDHLAGTWTEEEYRQFEEVLNSQRKIEEGLWR